MNLKDALAKVDDLLPALEKLLAPDAMVAFRTVYDAAQGSAVADVLREASRTAGEALDVARAKENAEWNRVQTVDGATIPAHLFLGGSGKPCALCDKPRDHDIHPNRGTP